MRSDREVEIKVGLFVVLGAALIMLAVTTLGGETGLFRRTSSYYVQFESAQGLIPGAQVVLSGIQIGSVKSVEFDESNGDVIAELKVARKYGTWIREDSKISMATQGLLGDKYLSISRGSLESKVLPAESYITSSSGNGLAEVLSKSDQLMVLLNSISSSLDRLLKEFEQGNRSERFFEGMARTASSMAEVSQNLNQELKNLKLGETSRNLQRIFEKIDNGTGTLGALVNDPDLYYDLKALVGGANRNRIVRNLVRKTIREAEEVETKAATEASKDETQLPKKQAAPIKVRAPGSR